MTILSTFDHFQVYPAMVTVTVIDLPSNDTDSVVQVYFEHLIELVAMFGLTDSFPGGRSHPLFGEKEDLKQWLLEQQVIATNGPRNYYRGPRYEEFRDKIIELGETYIKKNP